MIITQYTITDEEGTIQVRHDVEGFVRISQDHDIIALTPSQVMELLTALELTVQEIAKHQEAGDIMTAPSLNMTGEA